MSEPASIVIIEDDADINEVVAVHLRCNGFACTQAFSGSEGRLLLSGSEPFDLVITDLMLPGMAGEDVVRLVRARGDMPVIVMSARTTAADKVALLKLGADDYLTKPFSYTELVSRVKSLLRRYYVYQGSAPAEKSNKLVIRDLVLDKDAQNVEIGGEIVTLTDIEYRILELMMDNRKKVFSAQNIYESIWNEPYFYSANNTVMVHIRNLRKKLKDNSQEPQYIKTAWGKGYYVD